MAEDESSPFPVGGELSLTLDDRRQLTFTILKPFEPFTRFQAVHAHCATLSQSPLVVKIFDPRYFHERFINRSNNHCERQWTSEAEAQAVKDQEPLVRSNLAWFAKELEADEPPASDSRALAHRAARWEKHFQEKMRRIFETELEAYTRLRPLWGTDIPRLLAFGNYVPSDMRYIRPHAIVIEYIDGVSLYSTPAAMITPHLVRELGRILHELPRYGLLHGDANSGNILLDLAATPQRVVLIDFGQANLRKAGETAQEWDERIGRVMEWPGEVMGLLKLKRIPWQADFEIPFYNLPR